MFGVEMFLNLSQDFASPLHFHQWQKVSWYVFELSNTPHKFDMVVPCKMLTNPQSFLQFVRQHVLTSLGHTKNPTIYNIISWFASSLVCWDKWLIDQVSDVPSIIFFIISHRLRALKTLYFYFCKFIKYKKINWNDFCKEFWKNLW